jgi:hypothetical protein
VCWPGAIKKVRSYQRAVRSREKKVQNWRDQGRPEGTSEMLMARPRAVLASFSGKWDVVECRESTWTASKIENSAVTLADAGSKHHGGLKASKENRRSPVWREVDIKQVERMTSVGSLVPTCPAASCDRKRAIP